MLYLLGIVIDTLIYIKLFIILLIYKLGVLGDKSVGKTTLISQFRSKMFIKIINAFIGYFIIKEYKLTYYKV